MRNKMTFVRLTEDEHWTLTQAARLERMALSTYIRREAVRAASTLLDLGSDRGETATTTRPQRQARTL